LDFEKDFQNGASMLLVSSVKEILSTIILSASKTQKIVGINLASFKLKYVLALTNR